MDGKDLETFRKLLLRKKEQIINGTMKGSRESLGVPADNMADETDIANNVVSQNISFNIIHRDLAKIRLIDQALLRIKENRYGLCADCLQPIGAKRLTYQPWASLCIIHAEEEERERRNATGRECVV